MKKLSLFKLSVKHKSLAEIISLSVIFYAVLACIALCIGLALTTFFGTDSNDIPSVISNMFVWSATLIAPVIVILLIDSWKSQKNFDLKKEYASTILNELHLILFEILEIKSFVLGISEIDKKLVINKSIQTKSSPQLGDIIVKSYSNFKIIGTLFNDEFLDNYTTLEKHCFQVDLDTLSLKNLYISYLNDYFENHAGQKLENFDNFSMIYPDYYNKDYLQDHINNMYAYINLFSHKVSSFDVNTKEETIYGNYNTMIEMLDATQKLIEDAQDLCIETLNLENQ